MTDHDLPTTALEDRLRAALAAEADRHPVRPDIGALRARADRTVIDLRLPPRRNRARILAAAVVLATLVGAGVVAGQRDDGASVTAGGDGATGFYLPGDGWEVVGVSIDETHTADGVARTVRFEPPDGEGIHTVAATVIRVSSDELPRGWDDAEEVRGTGDGARPVRVQETGTTVSTGSGEGEEQAPMVQALARRPGEVLVVDATDRLQDEAVRLADRWLASGGRDLSVDVATGLVRWGDRTWATARPIDVGERCFGTCRVTGDLSSEEGIEPPATTTTTSASVVVTSPSGTRMTYTLTSTGATGLPTGLGADDGGEGGRLAPDEAPRTAPGGPGEEIWQVARGTAHPPGGQVGSVLPGADVEVVTTTDGAAAVDGQAPPDEAIDLVRGLRPVDRDGWVDAVGEEGLDPTAWGETLAGTAAPDPMAGATTVVEPAGGDAGGGEVPDPAATSPTAGEVLPETDLDAAARHVEALMALVRDQPVVLPEAFAERVTAGFVGAADADVEIATGDLLDTDLWQLPLDGRWGRDGTVSALDLLDAGGVSSQHPGQPEPLCTAGGAGPPSVDLFTYEATDVASCTDWFAVVVRVDDEGRIAEVRLRLWEP